MDTQADMQEYCNLNLSEGTSDRPLVTFALFAYNQEKYIREAVEGAFSQTYEPLEIILSDDCSSDRTFDVMCEMAAAYTGPHRVVARRNAINLMTALHVQSVAKEMSGVLMVVAAGDDISLPQRVERLVEAWERDSRRAVVLHSWTRAWYEGEASPSKVVRFKVDQPVDVHWFSRHQRSPVLAPTAAYGRCLFTDFPPLIGGSVIEDGPMIFRGFLKGEFLGIPEPLVIQRKLRTSLGSGYRISDPSRWNRFVRSKMISQMNKLQDLRASGQENPSIRRLERRFLSDIGGLSRCLISRSKGRSLASRMDYFVRLLVSYPNSYSLRGKVGFALDFCELRRTKRASGSET